MNYGPRDTTKPPTSAAVMRVWSAQLPGTEQRPKEKGPTICWLVVVPHHYPRNLKAQGPAGYLKGSKTISDVTGHCHCRKPGHRQSPRSTFSLYIFTLWLLNLGYFIHYWVTLYGVCSVGREQRQHPLRESREWIYWWRALLEDILLWDGGNHGIPRDKPCTLTTECQAAMDQDTLLSPSQTMGLRLAIVSPVAASQEQKAPEDEESTSLDSFFSH